MVREVPTSTYREHRPAAALAGHVVCVWSQAIGAGETAYRHRVLPDGCADVVWIGEAPAAVAGPATGPVVVALAPRTLVVGVRLRPGAAAAALGLPASELADRDTPLRDIWGPGADALCARVIEQPAIAARLAAAEAALARRVAGAGGPDPTVAAATRWLARHPEGRIAELAGCWILASAGCAVGLPPRSATDRRPSSGCCGCSGCWRSPAGVRDRVRASPRSPPRRAMPIRPHMSRELQALTGRSPGTPLQNAASTLELSDLFKTDAGRAA